MVRLHDIDRAKGLAILLVVIGHLADERFAPLNSQWYLTIKDLIYYFHMPFFMFLSGFIYFYTYKKDIQLKDYFLYAIKKINRLLPAFILFGLIILLGKMTMSGIVEVQNVSSNVILGVFNILFYPSKSVAISLWYIYVLLEILLIMPLILYVSKNSNLILVSLGVILYFIPDVPNIFMLHSVFHYFIFFVFGKIAIEYYDMYKKVLSYHHFSFLVFILSFVTLEFLDYKTSKIIVGTASIFALHSLVYSGVLKHSQVLWKLGYYSFVIYLMNTIIIGVGKGILLKFIPWSGWYFTLIYFPVLVLSAIIISILAKRYIFRYIKCLDKITS